jgi:uncharacterized LabA/DUF88 family protein
VRQQILKHEEKETDVNIAVEMFDAAHRDVFDDIYIVSADTDLAGAIKGSSKILKTNG